MGQILVYENGNAIGGEGHPNYARDITFENTGTDLVSENVESAIKEVNDKTKHGLYEVWVNSNPTASFAGQNIEITSDLDIDAFEVDYAESGVFLSMARGAVGNSLNGIYLVVGSNGKIQQRGRGCTLTKTGNVYKFEFGDATNSILNSYGSAPTSSTMNTTLIPQRILALLHNS